MGERGLIPACLLLLLTSATAIADPLAVDLSAFRFTGRMPSPALAVPAFNFVGSMPSPVLDVSAFSFVGQGASSFVLAGSEEALPVFGLAPVTRTTPALVMTGRRPQDLVIHTDALTMTGRRSQDLAITTGALQMTGRRPQSTTITTDKLEMTGRRLTPGQMAAADEGLGHRPRPAKFRLLRVVPLGAAGTNPFDFRDVRTDVAVALAGGSVAPTPGGDSGGVTPPTPVVPTALTLQGSLPAFEVKAGTPALIQVDTAAQTLSAPYSGAPQAVTPSTALSFSLNLIAFGNVTARLDEVAPWIAVSRDYPQPFGTSRTTCTVLRHTDGTHYKILLGVTESNTGYLMNSLSGTHHGSTAPSCP